MTQAVTTCLRCQQPIPSAARRYQRANGYIHVECDERRVGLDIVVHRVLEHWPNAQGGCTLLIEGDIGHTVRMTWQVTLPTAAEVAALKSVLAPDG